MPQYRYYCLGSDDHLLGGGELTAADVRAAIEAAHAACAGHAQVPSARIEVWRGENWAYTGPASSPFGPARDGKASD